MYMPHALDLLYMYYKRKLIIMYIFTALVSSLQQHSHVSPFNTNGGFTLQQISELELNFTPLAQVLLLFPLTTATFSTTAGGSTELNSRNLQVLLQSGPVTTFSF